MDHILTPDIDTCQYVSDTGSMTVQPVTIASSRELAEDACPIDAVACCAPLQTAPLAADDAIGLASVLKAIADPARLRLISLLAADEGGDRLEHGGEPDGVVGGKGRGLQRRAAGHGVDRAG